MFVTYLKAIVLLGLLSALSLIISSELNSQLTTDCRVPAHQSPSVIVQAAYFDDRPRDGHQNVSVLLLQVRKSILEQNLIVGCGAGKYFATNFSIRACGNYILNNWIHVTKPELTHDEVMVDCFDLPVQNGSDSFIIYKLNKNSSLANIVRSQQPLLKPALHKATHLSMVTCASAFGSPHWMTEWLHYQRTIGVDHVHITVDTSFKAAGGFQNTHLLKEIKEGFVSVDIWQQRLDDSEIYYHSEALAYENCIYKFRGTYDYAFMLDTDDFFVPIDPTEKRLHHYVNRWCQNGASCAFSWIEYYPDCGLNGEADDGNVTKQLKSFSNTERNVDKSVHKLSAVIDIGIHQAEAGIKNGKTYQLKYQKDIVKIPNKLAYVAHIKKNMLPPQNLGC